jgi:hypothetical protein
MLNEIEKAPSAEGAFSEMSSAGCCLDNSENRPPRQNTQIKFQDQAKVEFDAEIALALTASGWRATASLLTHAAILIDAGDFLSAERNRQSAREQFIAANDVFCQFREARAAEGTSIWAEAFL